MGITKAHDRTQLKEAIRLALANDRKVVFEPFVDGHEVDCPMAVLVNGNTASAAELFTASLRDYKKATVVGVKTYGKGCIQTLYPLSDGSNLRVTYGYYDPPYSDNYDGVGITPDITVVEDTVSEQGNSFFLRATDQDAPLQAAIAALTSDSAA